MKALIAPASLLVIGCATTAGAPEPAGPAGGCRAEALGELVGEPAAQELAAEAMRRSGARSLRWIRPGDMVTMDYRGDRLNVHLDAAGRVERFACG